MGVHGGEMKDAIRYIKYKRMFDEREIAKEGLYGDGKTWRKNSDVEDQR